MSHHHATDVRAEWHGVLLRLAGWLADEDLTRARASLAADRLGEVAEVVMAAIGTGLVPYSPQDAARLRNLLAAHTDDSSLVDAGVRQNLETPPYGFAPVPPWGIGPSVVDEADHAAMNAAATDLTRLWRVWRYPPTELQPIRRVYLAEVRPDADPAQVTGRIQEALTQTGETAPQVEAYPPGTRLPDYHRSALAQAEALDLPR